MMLEMKEYPFKDVHERFTNLLIALDFNAIKN